ncbi:hypothetical protein L4C33_20985 [Vibrio makurazakiensis]|uniref:hypothetical protein n=1 Tax=Vibrio makurazakiensis TaxID=2910250 RepID=UPI003D0A3E05
MKIHTRTLLLFVFICLLSPSKALASSLVLVVSNKNPTSSLTKEQVIDIYMGRYNTLPNGLSVRTTDLVDSHGSNHDFYDQMVKRTEKQMEAYWARLLFSTRAKPPIKFNSSSEVIAHLESSANNIGYIPEALVTNNLKVIYKIE